MKKYCIVNLLNHICKKKKKNQEQILMVADKNQQLYHIFLSLYPHNILK